MTRSKSTATAMCGWAKTSVFLLIRRAARTTSAASLTNMSICAQYSLVPLRFAHMCGWRRQLRCRGPHRPLLAVLRFFADHRLPALHSDKLPYFVICTHSHYDHIGSNYQFPEGICFGGADAAFTQRGQGQRKPHKDGTYGEDIKPFTITRWLQARMKSTSSAPRLCKTMNDAVASSILTIIDIWLVVFAR